MQHLTYPRPCECGGTLRLVTAPADQDITQTTTRTEQLVRCSDRDCEGYPVPGE